MNRLFVAVPLPPDVADELALTAGGLPGASWLHADDLHLTVRFLGDVDGALQRDVESALRRVRSRSFEVTLAGMGHFPPRGEPRSLWAGVARCEPLMGLRRQVDGAMTRLGIATDRRRWVPHVTVARLDGTSEARLARHIARHALYKSRPFEVDAVDLWSSTLLPGGPHYEHEAQFPL